MISGCGGRGPSWRSMLDWPPATQTSPTSTLVMVQVVSPATVRVCGVALARIGWSRTFQAPFVAMVVTV